MLDQKTIGWTPGPLSGAFSFFRITISGVLEMAPALPQFAITPRGGDSR